MTSQLVDPLTGAFTRALFNTRLQNEVQRALRYDTPLSLLMLDLDYFKSINDAFGHQRGDEALTGAVERIHSQLRESDEVFRYGGDEFVALLPHTPKDEAQTIAERILCQMTGSPLSGEPPLSLSVSIGVACAPLEAQTPQALFQVADQRHYQAKQMGRGRVIAADIFQPTTNGREPMDRLLGRDQALKTVREFLNILDETNSATLEIFGAPGSGRSRLIQETHRLARMRGYAVLLLQGTPALKNRLHGTLHEAIANWLEYTKFISAQSLADFFYDLIERKNLKGLIILLDNWRELDDGSLQTIRHLTQFPALERIGLVFSAEMESESPSPEFHATHSFSCALTALTDNEIRAWLRHSLENEPSQEVLAWFMEKTGGIPAAIARALDFLAQPHNQSISWNQLRPRLNDFLLRTAGKRNHLPLNLSLFVGRQRELHQIRQLLRQPHPVILLGQGGVGKTRLALQAALESQQQFSDGVYFVPISPLALPENIYTAIGQALGETVSAGADGQKMLGNLLAEKKVLLLLDNFESLPDAAPLLLPLLDTSPDLRILITSRTPLSLQNEINLTLEGLDCPPPESANISEYASASLFEQHARRIAPNFQPEWESIAEICRLVDGLPLGIELAAVWVSTFSCSEIAAQIQNNLNFLASQENLENDPHRSMSAVFESLWALFSAAEAQSLASLGIFRGRFSRAGARHIADISPFFIDALTAKTILRRVDENNYRIQPMLWDFLREKLRGDPALNAHLAKKHAIYYFNALQERAELFDDPALEREAILATNGQIQNLRAAWDFALQNKRAELIGPALKAYCAFLRPQGWFVEGVTLLQKSLPLLSSGEQKIYFQNAILLGEFFYHTGHYLENVSLLERLLPAMPRNAQMGLAMHRLSLAYHALGRANDSLRFLQKGAQLARELDDTNLLYEFSNRAAIGAYSVQEFRHAIALGTQALEQARQLKGNQRIAQSLNNLANFYYELHDLETAQNLIHQSLELVEQVNALALKASIFDSAGKILTASGDTPGARRAFLRGLTLLRQMNATPLAAELLTGIAELWHLTGDEARALPLARFICASNGVVKPIFERAERLALLPASPDYIWSLQTMQNAVAEVSQRLSEECGKDDSTFPGS